MRTSSAKRETEYDAFKGILISLIVLGHNTIFSSAFPQAFNSIYNFHVASFVLLPFLFFGSSAFEFQLKDRVVRYLVPHFIFFAIACVSYLVLFVGNNGAEIIAWLNDVSLAVIFSSEGTYKAASGFRFFWFLPTLLTLVLLRSAYFRGSSSRRFLIVTIAALVHLFLGFLPFKFMPYIPWGLPFAFFLFPLGLMVGELWQRGVNQTWVFSISAAIFTCCIYIGTTWPSFSGLAGDPRVFAVDQPLRLIFHDIYLMSAFFTLLMLCWRLPAFITKLFAFIGNRSLFIFLAHSFIWQGLVMAGFSQLLTESIHMPIISVLFSVAITLFLTLLVEHLLKMSPSLYRKIFPSSAEEWLGFSKLSRH